MIYEGKAFVYGDNIDTDIIIAARYLSTADPAELGKHCMKDLDPDFAKEICQGDIIVGGANFGCGSSREHAQFAIKGAGVSCVIASSFARIFYRNAINVGLPIAECPAAVADAKDNDQFIVDFSSGMIINNTQQKSYQIKPFPPFMQELIACGGLVNYTRQKLAKTSL